VKPTETHTSIIVWSVCLGGVPILSAPIVVEKDMEEAPEEKE